MEYTYSERGEDQRKGQGEDRKDWLIADIEIGLFDYFNCGKRKCINVSKIQN